jgi:hypothetical protein
MLVAVFLLPLLLQGQPPGVPLSAFLQKASLAVDDWLRRGLPPVDRTALVQLWLDAEETFRAEPAFSRSEWKALAALGQADASANAFRAIPDAALIGENEILRRLDQYYRAHDSAVLPLARQLATSFGDAGRNLLAEWIHGTVASDSCPRIADPSAAAFSLDFLRKISAVLPDVTDALATWIQVQQDQRHGAPKLGSPIRAEHPLALAPRYNLLTLAFVEGQLRLAGRNDESLTAEIQRRRIALVESLQPIASYGPYGPGYERARLRYWIAVGSEQIASALANGHEARLRYLTRAEAHSAAPPSARPDELTAAEAALLGGQRDFSTPLAEYLESIGYPKLALVHRLNAARVTVAALPALQELYSRLYPSGDFVTFWKEERFRHAERLLPDLVAAAQGRRWKVLKVWSPNCPGCMDTLSAVEAFVMRFGDSVALLDPDDPADMVLAFGRSRGLATSIVNLPPDNHLSGVLRAPSTILLAPDGRFAFLDETEWEREATQWLMLR